MKGVPDLDFARNRRAGASSKKVLLAVVCLVVGMQVGVASWRLQSLKSERDELNLQSKLVSARKVRLGPVELTAEQLQGAASAQNMLNALAVPWDELLTAVESARTPRILINAIQPRPQEGSVRISVTSPDFSTVADFVRRLAQQTALNNVMLVSETLSDNSGGGLRVVIGADWGKSP